VQQRVSLGVSALRPTSLRYEDDALLGSRLINSTAKKLAAGFFEKFA
jgi:hypothetical protein